MSSDKEQDTGAGGAQGAAPAEGDPPIIVHGQEGEAEEAEASSPEGDTPA